MNDFTKEELKLLWEYGHHLPGELRPILDKIKSMIDNYCEHSRYHTTRDSIYCEDCYKEII